MASIDRRALIVAVALLPAGLVAARIGAGLGAGVEAFARSLRPAAGGSTGDRCGACGSTAHTMLDPACPLAPAVHGRARA